MGCLQKLPSVHLSSEPDFHSCGIESSKLNQAIKSTFKESNSSRLFAHRIDIEHFSSLVELGIELGHVELVNSLLSQSETANLKPLFDEMLKSIDEILREKIELNQKALIGSLYLELFNNGYQVDKDNFEKLMFASLKENLGELIVSICDSENTDMEDYNRIHLSLESSYVSALSFRLPKCDLAKSVMQVLKQYEIEALLQCSLSALAEHDYGLSCAYNETLDLFKNSSITSAEQLLQLIVDEGESELLNLFEFDDEDEDTNENLMEIVSLFFSMYTSEADPLLNTFLSDWFRAQFKPIPENSFTLTSHGYPIHMVTEHEDYLHMVNNQYESLSEYCESRLILNPLKVIDTLATIANNRCMFLLYDGLSYLGHESKISPQYLKEHGLSETNIKIFE
ncbi:hypothetical protein DDN60_12810 [Vibrio cholerae]|nr:hypothetical protein [Vibrio cholerae]